MPEGPKSPEILVGKPAPGGVESSGAKPPTPSSEKITPPNQKILEDVGAHSLIVTENPVEHAISESKKEQEGDLSYADRVARRVVELGGREPQVYRSGEEIPSQGVSDVVKEVATVRGMAGYRRPGNGNGGGDENSPPEQSHEGNGDGSRNEPGRMNEGRNAPERNEDEVRDEHPPSERGIGRRVWSAVRDALIQREGEGVNEVLSRRGFARGEGDRNRRREVHEDFERETFPDPLRGLRRPLKRLNREELQRTMEVLGLEELPSEQKITDELSKWYVKPEEERFTRAEVERLNQYFQLFIEYTERYSDDVRLTPIHNRLENYGLRLANSLPEGDMKTRLLSAMEEDRNFDNKLFMIEEVTKEEVRRRGMRAFSVIEEDRQRITNTILDDKDNFAKYNEFTNKNKQAGRKKELEFLRGLLPEGDLRRAFLTHLIEEYDRHPIYREIGPIIEQRDAVIKDIITPKVKKQELQPMEPEIRLIVPERSFADALQVFEGDGSQEAKDQARADIEMYIAIADRLGFLGKFKDDAYREFLSLREAISRGERMPDGEVATYDLMFEQYTSGEYIRRRGRRAELVWESMANDKLTPDVLNALPGLSKEKVDGLFKYLSKRKLEEYALWLTPGNESVDDLVKDRLRGEWSLEQKLREEELRERRRGVLWRIGPTGIYEIMVDTPDPRRFRQAAESFVTNLVKSGVVDREPGSLMQKSQYFAEALTSRAQELADANFDPEDIKGKAEFMKEIKEVRMAFNVEIYAYCGELFNHSFNIENLAAIYSRMNNVIDGMDHWKVAMKLRDGQVYGVYLSQEDPEFELMWRIMGPHNQLGRYYSSQLRMHGAMMARLAEKRVGEVIWDRYEHVVDGKRTGRFLSGEEAKKANLNKLGFDISKKETLEAYVPELDDLIGVVSRDKDWLAKQKQDPVKAMILGEGEITKERLIETPQLFEIVFTPNEQEALRLRHIKALKLKEAGRDYNEAHILDFLKTDNLTADARERRAEADESLYDRAKRNAEEAVEIYMQLVSMTGDKARETGPSYVCNARKPDGSMAEWLRDAAEVDKVPKWRIQRLTQFVKNMAARKIKSFNTDLEKRAKQLESTTWEDGRLKNRDEREKHLAEAAAIRRKKILRGSDAYKKLMGNPADPKLIVQNSDDADPWHPYHDGEVHHDPPQKHFKEEIGSVVYYAITEIFDKGWGTRIQDFRIDEKGEMYFTNEQGRALGEMKIPGGVNSGKGVTLYTAIEHPLSMRMDKTYVFTQPDQRDDMVQARRNAQRFLAGEITEEKAGVLALQLITIDPALDRVVPIPNDKIEEGRYVMAAAEESHLNYNDITRAINRQWRGMIQWDYSSLASTGLRRLQHLPEFIATHDKLTPRAEWLAPFVNTFVAPLGDSFAQKHSFESIKLMKRGSMSEEEAKQQVLDPPELEAAAQLYVTGKKIYSMWVGSDKGPGFFEKPTASAENLTEKVIEENEIRPMTPEEKRSVGLPPNAHVEISNDTSHQLHLFNKLWKVLERAIPPFDPGYAEVSQNFGANGASDLRQIEIFEYDENGEVRMQPYQGEDVELMGSDVPVLLWDLNAMTADGLRVAEDIGRARHETKVVARMVTTYLKSVRLRDERGRKWFNKKTGKMQEFYYNGGVAEYGDVAYWLRHLNVYQRVEAFPAVDANALPEHLQRQRIATFEDAIVAKATRR